MFFDAHGIKEGKLYAVGGPDTRMSYVDTRDIADVAARVLMDPIDKHGIGVYEILSEVFSNRQRAEIFSKILGKEIAHEQANCEYVYNKMLGFGMNHSFAYDFVTLALEDYYKTTPQISILLGHAPRKLEDWIIENRNAFEK